MADKLKILTAKKEMYFQRIQVLNDYIAPMYSGDKKSLDNFKIRYESFAETRVLFGEVLDLINEQEAALVEKGKEFTPSYAAADAFEDLCCRISYAYKNFVLPKTQSAVQTTTALGTGSSNSGKIKLEALKLPTFSGEYRSWAGFAEIFRTRVHENSELEESIKAQYLVAHLEGKARAVIANILPTAANYETMWQRLKDKYEDKRLIARAYFDKIQSFKLHTVSSGALEAFLNEFVAAVEALKEMKLKSLSDFLLVEMALSKLDSETIRRFETRMDTETITEPTFADLLSVIKSQIKILERSKPGSTPYKKMDSGKLASSAGKDSDKGGFNKVFVAQNAKNCKLCEKEDHALFNCSVFMKYDAPKRYEYVKSKFRCYNCLSDLHGVKNCKSKSACGVCQRKHHTLLHMDNRDSVVKNDEPAQRVEIVASTSSGQSTDTSEEGTHETKNKLVHVSYDFTGSKKKTVLLQTAVVSIWKNGKRENVRVLLDGASQVNLITRRCCQKLKLKLRGSRSSIMGLGGKKMDVEGRTTFTFTPHFDSNKTFVIDADVLEEVTAGTLPTEKLDRKSLTFFENLCLADQEYSEPGPIDILLGASVYGKLLKGNKHCVGDCEALETELGYVITGSASITQEEALPVLCHLVQTPTLEELMEKFWLLEAAPEAKKVRSQEDEVCEAIYKKTTTRDATGRFQVDLPFKEDPTQELGESYALAKQRFLSLEKRLSKDEKLKEEYTRKLFENLELGFMEEVEDADLTEGYFMPHRPVINRESKTTPVRAVFDASMKTTSGKSLNDILYTGESLHAELWTVLINFRLFAVAFSADITKMFLQINVNPEQRKFLRFLFRTNPDKRIQVMQFVVIPFGVVTSPFLAMRTVRQLAEEEKERFPAAAEIVERDMYVDDIASSIPSTETAEMVFDQLNALFQEGGFQLAKWVVAGMKPVDTLSSTFDFDKRANVNKVLGLLWNPNSDQLVFHVQTEDAPCTKRSILSYIARIFDPLGLVAPVTLTAKLFMKELWEEGKEWDESPSEDFVRRWKIFCQDWNHVAEFQFERHIQVFEGDKINIVGFGDASEDAYGCCVYVANLSKHSSRLLCAKTRVAPMKKQTIPRLELCAALLLTQVMRKICDAYAERIKIEEILAFSDSKITVDRIFQDGSNEDIFVRNRIALIREYSPLNMKWGHVPGIDNPADLASRRCTPSQLLEEERWFYGPPWLIQEKESWPHAKKREQVQEEACFEVQERIQRTGGNGNKDWDERVIDNCSSYRKLLNTMVYVLRFLKVKLLKKEQKTPVQEVIDAEWQIFNLVQRRHFSTEKKALEEGRKLPNNWRQLKPFIDKGVIRVGGRLEHSNLPFGAKHPVLLPKEARLSRLLIEDCHRKNLHCGPQLTLSLLRQTVWILSGRSLVRSCLRACATCFRVQPKAFQPLMANLPKVRFSETHAFMHTGTDYAGPFLVHLKRGRGMRPQKMWLCVFTCMVTRAVHLEIAQDMSTEAFLQAFKRFISRRGPCLHLYSDRGTNFIGAKTQLADLYTLLRSKEHSMAFREYLRNLRIEWKLNPPSAPHFGGVWEAVVKSTKTLLYRAIGNQTLTLMEFSTVVTQIESILNSRPLYLDTEDPGEPRPITPAHFLMACPLKALPMEVIPAETQPHQLPRPALLNQIVQRYWEAWRLHFLHTLQLRVKWNTEDRPAKVGDVVLIDTANSPPLTWPMGVIEQLYGSDGVYRVADVRTKTGTLQRPLVKLCPFPDEVSRQA